MNTRHALVRDRNFVGGAWVPACSGARFAVTDPATGEVIGEVPDSGADDARSAIESAGLAFESWRRRPAAERADFLRALHGEVLAHQDELAELLTLEQGKPLAEARGEVGLSAAYILWFAEEARRVYGDVIPSPWPDRRILVSKAPVGVVCAITPWNFPSLMLARKIGPALASGCTIVIKPAPQTPLSGLAWGILAERCGIPAGVINIVTTDSPAAVGGEFTSNPIVRKITFTGSTAVGKLLMKQAADSVKRVTLELGGNAPFIVFDDADLDRAVDGAMAAKYRNAGQTCVCTNRFLVQDGIHDAFVDRLAAASDSLRVGPGLESGAQQGPLIDRRAIAKVEDLVADAVSHGARVVTGGKLHARGGTFYEPTVLSGATSQMRLAQEEIFGPVSAVFRFKTEEEAIRTANDTQYGLAAYAYTQDLGRAFRLMQALEYGIVGINEGLVTTEVAPFGGVKASGLGREGSHYGIDDYLDVKYACVGGLGL